MSDGGESGGLRKRGGDEISFEGDRESSKQGGGLGPCSYVRCPCGETAHTFKLVTEGTDTGGGAVRDWAGAVGIGKQLCLTCWDYFASHGRLERVVAAPKSLAPKDLGPCSYAHCLCVETAHTFRRVTEATDSGGAVRDWAGIVGVGKQLCLTCWAYFAANGRLDRRRQARPRGTGPKALEAATPDS